MFKPLKIINKFKDFHLKGCRYQNSQAKQSYLLRKEDDFQIISMLGKGSTSRVYLGFDIITQEKVVLKLFKNIPGQKIQRQIKVNTILNETNCPNIVNLLGYSKNQGCQGYTLCFQFIQGGIPLNYYVNNPQLTRSLAPKSCFQICYQVLQSLKVMHSNNMIHRDIKPANILISNGKNIKQPHSKLLNPQKRANLFDFGLTIIQGEHRKNNKFGTNCYKPPQTIFFKNDYDQKLDIWGVGLILTQLLSKKQKVLPYRTDLQMMQQIVELCGYSQKMIPQQLSDHLIKGRTVNWKQLLPNVEEEVINLLKQMLDINPQCRPSAQQILRNPVFAKQVKN